jgi:hypothetical protein
MMETRARMGAAGLLVILLVVVIFIGAIIFAATIV